MKIFDIIGPVMIGPSSSHTAGAVRLGRVVWKMLEEVPASVDIKLSGSFAETGPGHGTDKAVIAGCLGMHSWDERIPRSFEIAAEQGMSFAIGRENLPDSHPNTALIRAVRSDGKTVSMQGASIGGGNIVVNSINGIDVELSGQYNALLVRHQDQPGCIAAVTNCMAESSVNICGFRLSRKKRGGEAVMTIEFDGRIPEELPEAIRRLPNVVNVIPITLV